MSHCHEVLTAAALLSVPVRDGRICLLSVNVPHSSYQGQLLMKGNGVNDNITKAHKARAGPRQSSLTCACSRSAVSHTQDVWRPTCAFLFYVWETRRQRVQSTDVSPTWQFAQWAQADYKSADFLILKRALGFPLTRFLIISTNIARGDVNLLCAMCVYK